MDRRIRDGFAQAGMDRHRSRPTKSDNATMRTTFVVNHRDDDEDATATARTAVTDTDAQPVRYPAKKSRKPTTNRATRIRFENVNFADKNDDDSRRFGTVLIFDGDDTDADAALENNERCDTIGTQQRCRRFWLSLLQFFCTLSPPAIGMMGNEAASVTRCSSSNNNNSIPVCNLASSLLVCCRRRCVFPASMNYCTDTCSCVVILSTKSSANYYLLF